MAEGYVQGAQIVYQMFHGARPDDGAGHARLAHNPGQGELGQQLPVLRRPQVESALLEQLDGACEVALGARQSLVVGSAKELPPPAAGQTPQLPATVNGDNTGGYACMYTLH